MAKKRNAGRLPKYDPRETDARLSADLRSALKEKLSLFELIELEKQLRRDAEARAKQTCAETFELTALIFFRVLHDRFGFGSKRKADFWDVAKSYFEDVAEKRLTIDELRSTVREDGIEINWGDFNG